MSPPRIGEPPLRTHFDVFGLKRAYDVDVPALEKQYRELSLQLHPDRVAQASARERLQALEGTTALNEAFKTLKDPVRRAFYLLKLHGIDLDREDAGAQKDMPLAFLEEVMDLRESLDTAMAKKDLGRARAMADDVEARKKAALTEAAESLRTLEAGEPGDGGQEQVRKASHALGRVRYFTRFLEQVDAFEEEIQA
ncbi:Fe-S protein assembly co-chaperone HscB [Myxococcus xanthus DK 1622]|uniref:Co-chaperone protein HscB homolog n=2 Tax=Myxococcus xanthus TaxID=34 RepID=Q1D2G3_MYXXD|nr:Fe-S protein assembly co-chaperone HscB [Myxococcus xanthus DK 1622]NOJ56369.1 Fe-S protein assembly co-chaperone HscB [Myxococcus xanthus]NOJ80902.1 Fe-S protein assembly co-chaperone HscB [Myxococcus xanthus]NOJ88283.1 Fe-S protein assembly co-chaperone HscB [Myxococcus xanthus]QDE91723.1 Fe-S protein assembly co-chaperone HscB [Myxococcus xanthus]